MTCRTATTCSNIDRHHLPQRAPSGAQDPASGENAPLAPQQHVTAWQGAGARPATASPSGLWPLSAVTHSSAQPVEDCTHCTLVSSKPTLAASRSAGPEPRSASPDANPFRIHPSHLLPLSQVSRSGTPTHRSRRHPSSEVGHYYASFLPLLTLMNCTTLPTTPIKNPTGQTTSARRKKKGSSPRSVLSQKSAPNQ